MAAGPACLCNGPSVGDIVGEQFANRGAHLSGIVVPHDQAGPGSQQLGRVWEGSGNYGFARSHRFTQDTGANLLVVVIRNNDHVGARHQPLQVGLRPVAVVENDSSLQAMSAQSDAPILPGSDSPAGEQRWDVFGQRLDT